MMSYITNTYFAEYEELLIELSQAMREADTERANVVRRRMEGPERHLNESEMERSDGLAADLYMLSGKELFERTDPAEATSARLGAELRQAWERAEWESVLALLRKRMPFLSNEHRAYLRAVAYEHLGQLHSALLFMDYASQLNKKDTTYRYFGLDYLKLLGHTNEALLRARNYIADPTSAPMLLIEAAVTLVQTSKDLPTVEFLNRAEEAIPVLAKALDNGAGLEGSPREVIALAYATMGFCLQYLGDSIQSKIAYELALKVDPSNDGALIGLRAILESQSQLRRRTLPTVTVPTAASNVKMSNTLFETVKAAQIWAEAA